MGDGMRSPRILAVRWGRLDVEGIGAGKDFKLYPGGGREWNWDETGTRHWPGIQPADVEELLLHGTAEVVLSLGMNRRLRCPGRRRPSCGRGRTQARPFACENRTAPAWPLPDGGET